MPESVIAYIALGGNIGDVSVHFASACKTIDHLPNTKLIAKSKLYRTPPWGIVEQPNFLNACIKIETGLPPEELMRYLLKIESAHHRDRMRTLRFGPRPLDLDILAYGDVKMTSKALTLPHPQLFNRAFVLIPLNDIAENEIIDDRRIGDAAASCDATGITRLAETY